MSGLQVYVQGVGLAGPGLPDWPQSLAMLRGDAPHVATPTVLVEPKRLPPAESRRAGAVIRLAMQVADEAVAHAGVDPHVLATVFASSGGEGATCHQLCEALASPKPIVSPTRFTNSVHNAAAGNWHIAVASRAASTSLCTFDGSFAAGLLEAAVLLRDSTEPMLLVAYDVPYPEPLHSQRRLSDNFGMALVLTPSPGPASIAALRVEMVDSRDAGPLDTCRSESLDLLRRTIPAAASLPLLQALAAPHAGADQPLLLEYLPHLKLRVTLLPLAGRAAS